MSKLPDLYAFVMAEFRAKKVPQRKVAELSGVPFSTVTKIAQGQTKDPSVHAVQALANFFAEQYGWDMPDGVGPAVIEHTGLDQEAA